MLAQTQPLIWQDLVQLSDAELQQLDVALVHLLCAYGLPRTESLNIPAILGWIDTIAQAVREFTDKALSRRESLAEAEKVRHSEGVFRMACLVSVVQRDFGITTDNRLNKWPDFSDSRYVFLHGLVEGCGGTCANLPILYVAIARRLGYPLRLVKTAHHLFARWEGTDGRQFNVECTTPGLDCPPDEHYLTWPVPVDPWDRQAGRWLESKSPREELGGFLIMRAACLRDNGRYREAAEAAVWASAVAPANRHHLQTTERILQKWRFEIVVRRPARFPQLVMHLPAPRRFPDTLAEAVELEVGELETLEELILDARKQREWWGPLNSPSWGPWPAHVPTRIDATRPGPPAFRRSKGE